MCVCVRVCGRANTTQSHDAVAGKVGPSEECEECLYPMLGQATIKQRKATHDNPTSYFTKTQVCNV